MSVLLWVLIHTNDWGDLSITWFPKVWRSVGNRLPVIEISGWYLCTHSLFRCTKAASIPSLPTPITSLKFFFLFPAFWRALWTRKSSRDRAIRRRPSATRGFSSSELGRRSWLNCFSPGFFEAGLRWTPKRLRAEARPLLPDPQALVTVSYLVHWSPQ